MNKWAVMAGLVVAMPAMADVEVSNAQYHPDEGVFGKVTYDVTNNYDVAVSKILVNVVARTPGREVPWGDDGGGVSVAGGIEPGETRQIKHSPPDGVIHAEGHEIVVDVDIEKAYDADGDIIE